MKALAVGDRVGRYTVDGLLGHGGLATVYRVRHDTLGSLHALKLVREPKPELLRRLLQEGRIQASLRHPNIVSVTDVIEGDGQIALLMEYVAGATLQQLLARRPGGLPHSEALALFAQVLAGVHAAHQLGVLHRDLKPANILLAPVGTGVLAKVTDFGIAKAQLDAVGPALQTIAGAVMGTPGFMAPEQVEDASNVDARADVFSLGAILYQMITGEPPIPPGELGPMLAATIRGLIVPVRDRCPDCPAGIATTIESCLRPDPADRPDNCAQLATALYGDDHALTQVAHGVTAAAPVGVSMPASWQATDVVAAGPTAVPPSVMDPSPASHPTAVPLEPPAPSDSGAPSTMGGLLDPPAPATGALADPRRRSAAGPIAAGLLGMAAVFGASWMGLQALDRAPSAPAGPTGAAASMGSPSGSNPPPATASSGRDPDDTLPPPPPASQATTAEETPPRAAPPPATPTGVTPSPATPTPATQTPATTADAADTNAADGATPDGTTDGPTQAQRSPRPDPIEDGDPAPGALPQPTSDGIVDAAGTPSAPPSASEDDALAMAAGAAPDTDAPPPEATAPPPTLPTSWEGRWNGRPFKLRLMSQQGGVVTAELEVLVGAQWRTFALTGAHDATANRLSLSESGGGWRLQADAGNGRLSGTLQHPNQRRATPFTAQPR